MTQERLELIERYLGTQNRGGTELKGLLVVAWYELKASLNSLWAGVTLGHVDLEPRVERLKKALDQFKTVSADMTRDLGLEEETWQVIGLQATHPGANTVLDFDQEPEPSHVCGLSGYNGMVDPPCPGPGHEYDLGGEG